MRLLYTFLFTLSFYCASNAQTATSAKDSLDDEIEPYDYDTTLKGGYTIFFKVDDSLEYLYLKKGNEIIVIISVILIMKFEICHNDRSHLLLTNIF